jgi:predicted dehydrogenase
VEKPCGLTAGETKQMIAAAKKAKRNLFMHHNYRFKKESQYLFAQMKRSLIGPVFEIRANLLSYARRTDWQTLKKNGGGLLGNHGTHCLDVVLQLLGAPVKDLFCDMQHVCDAGDCEDHCKVVMRAANGRVAEVTLSTSVATELPRWILCGRCGTMLFDGKTAKLKFYDPKKAPALKVNPGTPAGRKYGTGEVLPWEEKLETADDCGIGNIYDNVVGVLRRGEKMYVTPESVLAVVELLDRCRKMNPKFA